MEQRPAADAAGSVASSADSAPLPVTRLKYNDISVIMPPRTEPNPPRRQSLRGFDPEYVDIVDYIVRCTHRIWEEHGVGLIYTHYAHNAVVHGASGASYTRDEVVANTVFSLQAFPDLRAYADDVVWSGNDVDGFYSSHRVLSISHNWGYGRYGPPTGRRVIGRGFADCIVKENRIVEEWVVRDESWAVRQLGLDVHAVVAQLARQRAEGKAQVEPLAAVEQVQGQTTPEVLPPPPSEGFDPHDFVTRTWHEVWNWRFLNRITERYAPTLVAHVPGGRDLYSREEYFQFAASLLAPFPDGRMFVDHVNVLDDGQGRYRTALRWRFHGTHLYPGVYGPPTGKRARVLGITHHAIQDGLIVEEWTVFDEIALLLQLAAA